MVGPYRLAMAQKRTVILSNSRGVKVGDNIGAADAYAFVGVVLPADAPPLLPIAFSKDDTIGASSGFPMILQPGGTFGQFGGGVFTQLLLPGEQLFAQILGAVAEQRVLTAMVQF
jgi:hypothetical protein